MLWVAWILLCLGLYVWKIEGRKVASRVKIEREHPDRQQNQDSLGAEFSPVPISIQGLMGDLRKL